MAVEEAALSPFIPQLVGVEEEAISIVGDSLASSVDNNGQVVVFRMGTARSLRRVESVGIAYGDDAVVLEGYFSGPSRYNSSVYIVN